MHPILFRIGPGGSGYAVHTYGVLLMLAFIVSIIRTQRVAKRLEGQPGAIPSDDVVDVGIAMIVCGVIGARLLYVLTSWSQFAGHPLSGFRIWEGGLSFHGSLIGGLIALIVYCRVKKHSILKMTDLFAPSVMISYAIGRIGCFFNGCCYGAETHMPWGIRFDEGNGIFTQPCQPTQLYAAGLSLLFFAGLVWLERRKAFDGQLMCWYVVGAAVERFVMEIWRAGTTSTVVAFGLTDVQILCITMLIGALGGLIFLSRRARVLPRRAGHSAEVARS